MKIVIEGSGDPASLAALNMLSQGAQVAWVATEKANAPSRTTGKPIQRGSRRNQFYPKDVAVAFGRRLPSPSPHIRNSSGGAHQQAHTSYTSRQCFLAVMYSQDCLSRRRVDDHEADPIVPKLRANSGANPNPIATVMHPWRVTTVPI